MLFLINDMDFTVSENDGIIRLDRFLLKSGITHAIVCRLIRRKRIKLNDQVVMSIGDRVKPGDNISIDSKISITNNIKDKILPQIPKSKIRLIEKSILYEDMDIIAINKPYGLATQSGGSLRFSLDDIMREIRGPSVRIVHRLDKETSGVIIMAKNHQTAVNISRALHNRVAEKTYLAVLSPIPKDDSGMIETRNMKVRGLVMNKYEAHREDFSDGKVAITRYKIIGLDTDRNIALVSFDPKTGRTHQLRIHAAHILSPIVGDKRYGGDMELSKKLQLFSYRMKIPSLNIDIMAQSLPSYFLLSNLSDI